MDHFPHSAISLFQSAVATSETRRRVASEPEAVAGELPLIDHSTSMLRATARAASAVANLGPAAAAAALRQGVPMSTIDRCAHAYLALAMAEAHGDEAAIKTAREDLPPFGTCDAHWAEALSDYLLHMAFRRHSDIPYRPWLNLDDFVIGNALRPNAKIAVFGDWGTGEPRAQSLLEAIAAQEPNVVIHLGDIYYACSLREADAFYRHVKAAFPDDTTSIFSLCGNHDMYSGGAPYYALLDRLKQPASFFCLRNEHWQILSADTGFNDYNPFDEARAVTWVRDGTDDEGRDDTSGYSELAWHADKLHTAAGRKTILLTHHPLFTRHSPIAGKHVCNERLLKQFGPWLNNVTLWLWGHEHGQIIYQEFAGLRRGRCVGASAIPTLESESPYEPGSFAQKTPILPDLLGDPGTRLRLSDDHRYDLGFALITLDGASAEVTYHSFNRPDDVAVVHREVLS